MESQSLARYEAIISRKRQTCQQRIFARSAASKKTRLTKCVKRGIIIASEQSAPGKRRLSPFNDKYLKKKPPPIRCRFFLPTLLQQFQNGNDERKSGNRKRKLFKRSHTPHPPRGRPTRRRTHRAHYTTQAAAVSTARKNALDKMRQARYYNCK